jgi:threonylcarbamoyladenosine tRNA methylthiotransferase MtaB
MLHILSDKKRRAFYEENIGSETEVLFENDVENGMMHGFTNNYIRVTAKYDPILINEIKAVRLTRVSDSGLMEVDEVQGEVFAQHPA